MSPIPEWLKKELEAEPQICARKGNDCKGRITWEHAFIYGGNQIQEKWAIIFLCEYHHGVCNYQEGGDLKKEINHWIAINRMTSEDMAKYPRKPWQQLKKYLNTKYGEPNS
ncbi:MAG: hypothetical protein WC208_15985 [Gallionella sp.]|jgi:hypothetical protein